VVQFAVAVAGLGAVCFKMVWLRLLLVAIDSFALRRYESTSHSFQSSSSLTVSSPF
jgi:hypothetical protein